MRSGLITLGTLLLVLGIVFFYLPTATTTATSVQTGEAPQTTYAAATLPLQLSLAAMIGGVLLIIFGLFIPARETNVIVERHHRDEEVVHDTQRRKAQNQ